MVKIKVDDMQRICDKIVYSHPYLKFEVPDALIKDDQTLNTNCPTKTIMLANILITLGCEIDDNTDHDVHQYSFDTTELIWS